MVMGAVTMQSNDLDSLANQIMSEDRAGNYFKGIKVDQGNSCNRHSSSQKFLEG